MSRIKRKVSYQGLKDYDVYLEDNDNSIFNVTGVPEVFPLGKSYFLTLGSPRLRQNTKVLVEIIDHDGNTVYYEIPDYLEGTARAISIWVFNDVAAGEAQITLLGELSDVPIEWQGKYNVRQTRKIYINPTLENSQPIRFESPPVVIATTSDKRHITFTENKIEYASYSVGKVKGRRVGNSYLIEMSGSGAVVNSSFKNAKFYAHNLKISTSTALTGSYSASIIGILNETSFYVYPPPYVLSPIRVILEQVDQELT